MTGDAAVYPIPDTADAPTRTLIERVNAAGLPPFETLPPAAARAEYLKRAGQSNVDPVPVGAIENIPVAAAGRTIGTRLYRPEGVVPPAPLLFYFHGGGFVIGDLETHDPICRRICRDAGALVLAVDYRLAPEHRFPAAVEDVFAVYDTVAPKAAALGADPARLWVGGDSAGGTLAAVSTRRIAAGEGPTGVVLAGQILVYPALDRVGAYPSHAECAGIFPLTQPVLDYFDRHYFPSAADKASPLASPGHFPPAGPQPPALILAAGLDPLRDEAAVYAAALAAAGTPVRYHCYDGTIHGFLDKGRLLPTAEEALAEIAAAMRDGSSRPGPDSHTSGRGAL
jgi:acetyl esterase/lipase